jgi:hypothetical protein
MSFVTAAPEFVMAAAGDLADIGSALGAANAVAALPTTGIAAAAADEVSTQIAAMFGAYAQKYQALSAQSAAFHNEFVSLLNGSALTYLSTELTNAEQTLMNTVTGAAGSGAATAATLPLLGGGSGILGGLSPVVGGGPLGPILNGFSAELGGVLSNILNGSEASLLSNPLAVLQPLLPGLHQTGMTGIITSQAGNPWAVLFANTNANLQSLVNAWAADPFPFLRQVIANQQHYAQELGSQIAVFLQDFPANVPTNIGLAIAGVSAFNPGALAQTLINQQIGYINTISTSLQKAGADLQTTIPVFEADMGMANQAIATGNYPGAVQDFTHGLLGLFITGFDTSNLSDVKILGPAGDLLPILGIPAQQAQNFLNLLPPGSIPAQIAQNYTNAVTTLTNTDTSTTFALNLTNPSAPILVADAFFGVPLSLGFSLLGAPVSGLNGLATGATVLEAAAQAGNGVGVVGALVDMPAYVMNGFLNGQTIVDLTLPVSTATVPPSLAGPLGPLATILLQLDPSLAGSLLPTVPIVVHLPFDGLLVPPQSITATVDVTAGPVTVPININLGGTEFGGLVPALVNSVPEQLASAITPK